MQILVLIEIMSDIVSRWSRSYVATAINFCMLSNISINCAIQLFTFSSLLSALEAYSGVIGMLPDDNDSGFCFGA
jgi:hypothetical protein